MSLFDGYQFFFILILVLGPAVLLGTLEQPLKWYSLAATFLFAALAFFPNPTQLFYLILFYLLEAFVVKGYLTLRNSKGRVDWIYKTAILLCILPLIICKISGVFHLNLFGFLGISYLTFRCVQIVIETYDGIIKELSILDFTAFLLFFPSLSSGPIDRSRRFLTDWNTVYSRSEYLELAGDGIFKLLLGLIYKLVLASAFFKGMGALDGSKVWYCVIGYAYCYGFYLFFDFAGYSLMAVGTSYLLGIRTPDNFNKPFLSTDLKDFWDRWHITLSHWFRDFIFSRFMIHVLKKKYFKNRLNAASAGFIVNMFIMGLWHGITPSYILYGLYHGILLALTERWQKKSAFHKANKQKKWYRFFSWFLTLQLVMIGFYIFNGKFLWLLGF
nr:D-alanyl-lipoteichoic acid biosynthesis protein DltB [uncultured Sellimonas sp.]